MNPHQKNKVDVSKLDSEEQKLFRLYGKLPSKTSILQNKLKERKYFDSGDYALSKAGKASDIGVTSIGHGHPNPESIPHLSTSPANGDRTSISGPTGSIGDRVNLPPATQHTGGNSGSPVKESSMMNRTQSVDDQPEEESQPSEVEKIARTISPPAASEGMPIRGGQ